jgi:hypothetical protein
MGRLAFSQTATLLTLECRFSMANNLLISTPFKQQSWRTYALPGHSSYTMAASNAWSKNKITARSSKLTLVSSFHQRVLSVGLSGLTSVPAAPPAEERASCDGAYRRLVP